jgi:hypothetical protein
MIRRCSASAEGDYFPLAVGQIRTVTARVNGKIVNGVLRQLKAELSDDGIALTYTFG